MAIFGCILTDACVRVGDRLRIDASRNSVTPDMDAISLVEVDPDGSGTYFDVSSDLFLDWQYSASGTFTIQLRVTAGAASEIFAETIEVKDEQDDCLFSDDSDLLGFEPSIRDCLDCHRCNFNHIHRQIAKCIYECLRDEGLLWHGCELIDIAKLKGSEQLRKWSTFWALENIYRNASKSPEDFWAQRSQFYKSKRVKAFGGYKIFFDKDGDGKISRHEYKISTNRLVRK